MNTVISEATASDRDILANLLQLYTHDFTDFEDWNIGDDGRFSDEPVQRWLDDPLRQPYIIRIDEKIAGFALVDRGSRISGDPDVIDMGEFFIMRRYRRQGVGTDAARWLFERYPATWEVR
jgi:predicted acetyltransferase